LSNTPVEFKALFLGDLVGLPGYGACLSKLPGLIALHRPQLVVVNAENAAEDGLGLLPEQFAALIDLGVHVVTTGNHIWEKKEIYPLLASEARLLRPDNYPAPLPGKGWCVVDGEGWKAAVVNLQGRSRMAAIDDPFIRGRNLAARLSEQTPLIFFDFHAEAPDEKEAFGFWLDGIATAVVGTHTHVATADERLLPLGTAFQSDLGMCGPEGSVIGGDPDISVQRALTMLPLRSTIFDAPARVRGALVTADAKTGRALSILRFEA
jgi:metallophosphoesterase (TIGR00282 family)